MSDIYFGALGPEGITRVSRSTSGWHRQTDAQKYVGHAKPGHHLTHGCFWWPLHKGDQSEGDISCGGLIGSKSNFRHRMRNSSSSGEVYFGGRKKVGEGTVFLPKTKPSSLELWVREGDQEGEARKRPLCKHLFTAGLCLPFEYKTTPFFWSNELDSVQWSRLKF